METILQQLAATLFRSVAADPEAGWSTMAEEERDDALEWTGELLRALRAVEGIPDQARAWIESILAA